MRLTVNVVSFLSRAPRANLRAHDVVNGAGIFDASLAGHVPRQATLPN